MYLIQISCIICFGRVHFHLREKADCQIRHQNFNKQNYTVRPVHSTSAYGIRGYVHVIIAGNSVAALFVAFTYEEIRTFQLRKLRATEVNCSWL
jgi:hypothetical protein